VSNVISPHNHLGVCVTARTSSGWRLLVSHGIASLVWIVSQTTASHFFDTVPATSTLATRPPLQASPAASLLLVQRTLPSPTLEQKQLGAGEASSRPQLTAPPDSKGAASPARAYIGTDFGPVPPQHPGQEPPEETAGRKWTDRGPPGEPLRPQVRFSHARPAPGLGPGIAPDPKKPKPRPTRDRAFAVFSAAPGC